MFQKIVISFISLVLIICSYELKAQENINKQEQLINEIYSLSLKSYLKNDELINGCEYIRSNTSIKGNPFLKNIWSKGTVYINGNAYLNTNIKYDIVTNDFILKTNIYKGVDKELVLNKLFVDSLRYNNLLFINSYKILDDENFIFYELLFVGRKVLLKKYSKELIEVYNRNSPAGMFSDINKDFYMYDKGEMIKISNLHSFLSSFEKENKKAIKKYLKKNKIVYSKISDNELVNLYKFTENMSFK